MTEANATEEQEPQPGGVSMANELIRARADMGYTQAHLAEVSGVSRSAIKAYETGRSVPGSRELRALCMALKVTPNRLLFGTEAPTFDDGEAGKLEALLRSDPEQRQIARVRLALLSELLTADESDALLLLVQSIATARHGAEKVKNYSMSAAFMAALPRFLMDEGARAQRTGTEIDTDRARKYFEDWIERHELEPAPGSPAALEKVKKKAS